MRIMGNTLGAASCLAVALTSGHVSAAFLAYDGFDYAAGDLTGKNGGAGYTDSGNSTVVDAAGLTYSVLATTGGSDRTADRGTATTLNFRTLNQVYGDNETETWVSLLGRRNGVTVMNLFAGLSFYNSGGTAAANGELSIAATTQDSTVPGLPDWRILDLGATADHRAFISLRRRSYRRPSSRPVQDIPGTPTMGQFDAGPAPRYNEFIVEFSKNSRRVYGYIRTLAPNINDANKVYQNVSPVLWNKFQEFTPGSNFFSWSCQIALYEVRKLRDGKARAKMFSDESLEMLSAEFQRRRGNGSWEISYSGSL